MLTIENPDEVVYWGDNLADVGHWLVSTPRRWSYDSSTDNHGHHGAHSWALGATYQDCLRMAREGWSEGAKRAALDLAATMPPTTSHAKLKYDVAGYYPDVPKYLTGLPDNMITRGRVRGQAPVVSIVVGMTASAIITADEYSNFGVGMAAVIDRLEASGRRVELYVAFPNRFRTGQHGLFGWRVKEAGEHTDLGTLCFSLAHPAAYRRVAWGLWERTRASNADSGYGHCVPVTKQDVALLGIQDAWIIDANGSELCSYSDPERAIDLVIAKVNQAAGEVVVSRD